MHAPDISNEDTETAALFPICVDIDGSQESVTITHGK